MSTLHLTGGLEEAPWWSLQTTVTLGRGPNCRVQVYAPTVSRVHAQLTVENGHWAVIDLGSKNGTSLNGLSLEPHTPHPLRDGDILRFGGWISLVVRIEEGVHDELHSVA